MNILVIGGGGREHAIVYKLSQSRKVSKIFCAPGNAGISRLAECVDIGTTDTSALISFAHSNRVRLTIVGPEAPLAEGICDSFRRAGLKVFGPSKEAARIETSKSFAHDFCGKYGIPSARYAVFGDAQAAKEHVKRCSVPVVVKADGLASGKGVFVCGSIDEAGNAIDDIMLAGRFGEAGKSIVVEEYLAGQEASFIAVCDGNHVLPLQGARDYKRLLDKDAGPNTGGMGAYSSALVVDTEMTRTVMNEIMLPAARCLVTEGMPFIGALYAGLMVRDGKPKVLEFNARFGDPETQALLVRLKTDLLDVIEAAVSGTLDNITLEWDERPSVCVVIAASGYPLEYEKGKVIHGLEEAGKFPDVFLFHAGTKFFRGDIVTNGGRVLSVTALGSDLQSASKLAYDAVLKISFDGMYFRKDIGCP